MRFDRFITLNAVRPIRSLTGRSVIASESPRARRLTILMYHGISENSETKLAPYYRTCTRPEVFERQMALLKSVGCQGVTLTNGVEWLNNASATTTATPVAITFDDGFRDFYTAANPILQRYGFSATMYLPTAFIGETPRIFEPRGSTSSTVKTECMTWAEVRELHGQGIEFGSHTVNHPKLVDLGWAEIETELRDSKQELETRLGAPVPAFAYPYAFPQADREFAEGFRRVLQQAGYQTCVTTEINRPGPGHDPFRLARLPANSDDDDTLLLAKLAGNYDWLGQVQRLSKNLKHRKNARVARKPYADNARPVAS
jgi:peptidoglycan/xylan/chitin deacetylase (PgdA/CDA1 family)